MTAAIATTPGGSAAAAEHRADLEVLARDVACAMLDVLRSIAHAGVLPDAVKGMRED